MRVMFIWHKLNSRFNVSRKSDFGLSQIEEQYLRTGKTGSYSEKELQRRIRQKSDKIDSRIENLIDDVILMYLNGYFDDNKDIESFCDVFNLNCDLEETISMTVTRREIGAHPENTGKRITRDHREPQLEKTEEIGYMVGIFLHLLMTMAPEERPWDEMLKGILMFFIMNPNFRSDEQLEKLEELIDFRMKLPATEIRSMTDVESEYEYRFSYDESTIEVTSKIEDELNERNIPVNNRLVNYIISELENEWDGLNPGPTIDRKLKNLEYLEEIVELCRTINTDISRLSEKWRGPSRIEIIKKRYDPDVNNHSKSIASSISKSRYSNLVSEALNKMSDKVENDNMWTTYPIFEEVDGELEFTPYGQLFTLFLIGDINFNTLFTFAIPNGGAFSNDISDKKLIFDVLTQTSADE